MAEFLLLGLAGPAGVGKTTAACWIGMSYGFSMLGFADPIREAALALFPAWDSRHMCAGKDQVDERVGIAPRHALRVIGDHARALQPDIYVRALARRVLLARNDGAPGAIIHDLRMPGEAAWLRAAGGTLIHVQRDGLAFRGDHPTEDGLPGLPDDCALHNPGTLLGLRAEIDGVLVHIRRRRAA